MVSICEWNQRLGVSLECQAICWCLRSTGVCSHCFMPYSHSYCANVHELILISIVSGIESNINAECVETAWLDVNASIHPSISVFSLSIYCMLSFSLSSCLSLSMYINIYSSSAIFTGTAWSHTLINCMEERSQISWRYVGLEILAVACGHLTL